MISYQSLLLSTIVLNDSVHTLFAFTLPVINFQTTFIAIHHDAEVGMKSYRSARECISFVHVYILAAILYFEQTHAVYNAAWMVSDSYIC